MKKIKLLMPVAGIVSTIATSTMLTSCSCFGNKTTYTVTFDSNTNGEVANREQKVISGETVVPALMARTNYTLDGWYTNKQCTTNFDFRTKIQSNITLYAKWKAVQPTSTFTVTFNSMGGTNVPTQEVGAGKCAIEPADPWQKNKTFTGWYENESCTGDAFNFATPITQSKTLYAGWIDTPASAFFVTFYDGDSILSQQEVAVLGKAVRPQDPTKANHTFKGWYKESTFENEFNFNDQITANTSVYAKFEPIAQVTVQFNTGTYGSSVSSQTINAGTCLTQPTDPIKTRAAFAGWYTDAACTKSFDFATPVSQSMTLYAKWDNEIWNLQVYDRTSLTSEVTTLEMYVGDTRQALKVNTLWTDGTHSEVIEEDTKAYTLSGATGVLSYDNDTHVITATTVGTGNLTIKINGTSVQKTIPVKVTDPAYKYLTFTLNSSEDGYLVSANTASNVTMPETLNIPETYNGLPVVGVNENGFKECSTLKTVHLPSTIKEIGARAFKDCQNIININLPEGLTTIGQEAFLCITRGGNIASLSLPTTLTTIEDFAFGYQKKLQSIFIPKKVSYIGLSVFAYCENLINATIEEGTPLTSILGNTFQECKSLTSFVIPEGITSIGQNCFNNCTSLTTITIPSTLTSICTDSETALVGTTKLSRFIISTSNTKYYAYNSTDPGQYYDGNVLCCTEADGTDSICYVSSNVTQFTIPASVEKIYTKSFSNCTSLTAIEFESNSKLTTIGWSAFNGCEELETVDLSNCTSLTTIGRNAFSGCDKLSSLTLPSDSTAKLTLEGFCFSSCTSLTTIIITSQVEKINGDVFKQSGIDKMYFGTSATTWKNISANTFTSVTDVLESTTSTNYAAWKTATGETDGSWTRQ